MSFIDFTYYVAIENGIYWIAYIVDNLLKECLTESKDNCPGCKDGKKSPILHLHLQLGLKDILEFYLHASTVKVDVLREDLLMKFEVQLNIKLNEMDTASYISLGQLFMKTCTPGSIYYGNYVNEVYDDIVNKPVKKILKRKK